jgi:hypothetical protein
MVKWEGIKMRKLTQSVSRIIKFYLALVQTTGRKLSVIGSLREGLLIKNVGTASLSAE